MKPNFQYLRVRVFLAVLFLAGTLSSNLFAWTKEVEEAANAVAKGTATPQQLAVAFQNNQAINQMAAAGKIPQNVYTANQQKFDAINKTFIEKAAAEAGLNANQQVKAPGATPKPGADTDIIVTKGKGQSEPITQSQVNKMNQAYQNNVQKFLNNRGVNPQGPVNTQTDFMPHPEHTTPQEFQKINQNINKAGGTAYENPVSAKVEAAIRKGQPINVNEAGQYASEMQNLAQQKLNHANQLNGEAAKLPAGDPRRAELSAEAQINRSQAAKYTERINTVGEAVCKQNGVPPAKAAPMDGPLASSVHNANVNRGSGSIKDTHIVGALGDKAVGDAAKNFSENMANVIKSNPNAPGAKDAVKNIADQTKNMTPSQKGEVIDNVRRTAGDKAAQDVANAMKNTKPSAPVETGGSKSPVTGEPAGVGKGDGVGGQKGAPGRSGEVGTTGEPGAGPKGEVAGPKAGEPGKAGGGKPSGEVAGAKGPAAGETAGAGKGEGAGSKGPAVGEPAGVGKGEGAGGKGGAKGEVAGPKTGGEPGAGVKTGEVPGPRAGTTSTGEVRAPGAGGKPGTVEAGIIKSGTPEAPGAGGPKGEGLISKGMKVLGPIMIIKDGVERIHKVATAQGDKRSEEATTQLGGFTGGTAGATGGAIVGAKAGALLGGIFGPVGATVGGVVGGLYGGYKGYQKGAEVGEKNAGGVMNWLAGNNKTTQQTDKAAGLHGVADGLYNAMVNKGISPDRAKDITDRIKNGDPNAIKEVKQINKELHEKQQQQDKDNKDKKNPEDKAGSGQAGGDKAQGQGDKTGAAGQGGSKGNQTGTGGKDGDDDGGDKDGEKGASSGTGAGGKNGDKGGAGGHKNTGTGNKGLEGSEAGLDENGDSEGGGSDKGGGKTPEAAGLGGFVKGNEEGQTGKGDYEANNANAEVNTATTSSAQARRDAERTRDEGGKEAQGTRDQSATEIAQGDSRNTWGTKIGDGLEQGFTQGGQQIGTAIGAHAAGAATEAIFGNPNKNKNKNNGGGGKSGDGTDDDDGDGSSAGGSNGGNKNKPKPDGGKSDGGDSGGQPDGGGTTAGDGTTGGVPGDGTTPGGGTVGDGSGIPGDATAVTVSADGTAGGAGTTVGAPVTGAGSGGQSMVPVSKTIDGGAALAGKTVVGASVSITYDAYSIPDQFQASYGGASLADSGMTSGSGTLSGKGAGSSSSVTVTVICPKDGTSWTWSGSVTFYVK